MPHHNKTHGMSRTRIYATWRDMNKRCSLATSKAFKHYGGRGISVCDEWRNDFRAFHAWAIANGYSDNLTIDRYPNKDGNYEPTNCRWATQAEQVRNTSRNDFITYRGRTLTLSELAREHGLSQPTLWRRLHRFNWELERALTTVSRGSKSCPVTTKPLSSSSAPSLSA